MKQTNLFINKGEHLTRSHFRKSSKQARVIDEHMNNNSTCRKSDCSIEQ